jgi:hypothetical protein
MLHINTYNVKGTMQSPPLNGIWLIGKYPYAHYFYKQCLPLILCTQELQINWLETEDR